MLVAVYSWDLILALLAILGALAAFGGQAAVAGRTVDVSVAEQALAGLSAAAYAALLILLATLLTRRKRWVRLMQIATLATAIVLGGASLLVAFTLPNQGLDPARALTSLLVLLIDAAVIVVLTAPRMVAWYAAGGPPSRWVVGTLGFWAASGAALILLQAVR